MSQHGKNYRSARGQIDREQLYSPAAAVKMLKGFETAKFDESVEVHFNLGLNVRHAEQQLRGTLMLPHGTGREARVAVFAEGDKAKEAEEAGADIIGTADLANFLRVPYGPGWALVGDAGYHKDPQTGQGIRDAFRDADLVASAVDAGLSGRVSLEAALADYQRRRDEHCAVWHGRLAERQ